MKEKLYELIQKQQETLFAMADQIHDDPEYDGEEYHASAMLEDYLEQHGFQVERGLENWPTAFRATWGQGDGGPRIGLLCEYDALRGLGHGCGHHMQGPCICATAIALKEAGFENPFQLVVYGTPAEETRSAKVSMWESGYFRDMDVALMMHGGPDTCVDETTPLWLPRRGAALWMLCCWPSTEWNFCGSMCERIPGCTTPLRKLPAPPM